MIISIVAEKAFGKIQMPFMIKKKNKALQKVAMEGNYLNIIWAINNKPTANIILNGKTRTAFLLIRNKDVHSQQLLSIDLEVLAMAIR